MLPRKFFFTCEECKVENIQAMSNRQKVCESCREVVKKRKRKIYNAKRRKDTPERQCIDCKLWVKEPYMELRCKKCRDIHYGRTQKYCKECEVVALPSNRSICNSCSREKNLKRMKSNRIKKTGIRVCRNVNCKKSIEGYHRSERYCSDECRKYKPVTYRTYQDIKDDIRDNIKSNAEAEAEERFEIDPFFLKPRGSKRR